MTDSKNPAGTIESMEAIEATRDVEYATIPGFVTGQTLEIGSLTAGDLIEWSESNDGEAKRTAGLRLICRSLVTSEEKGRVRYAAEDKNIAVFRRKSHKATERIVKEILKLNGMTVKQDDESKKD
jgi:hypothetical protein